MQLGLTALRKKRGHTSTHDDAQVLLRRDRRERRLGHVAPGGVGENCVAKMRLDLDI